MVRSVVTIVAQQSLGLEKTMSVVNRKWSAAAVMALALLAGCKDSEFARKVDEVPVAQFYGEAGAPHTAAVRWQMVNGSLIEQVCKASSLKELSIVTSQRDGTPIFPHIAEMPNLESLNVIEVPLSDYELIALAEAKKLTSIELSRTGITGDGLKHLAKLPLKRLTIREQHLTLEGLQAIASMTDLEELELTLSEVQWADMPELACKAKLRSLSLIGGLYSFREHGGLKCLVGAPNLAKVVLSGHNLNDRTVATISTFERLQYLSIENCMVSEESLEYLSRLQQLQWVHIPSLNSMHSNGFLRLADCTESEQLTLPVRG